MKRQTVQTCAALLALGYASLSVGSGDLWVGSEHSVTVFPAEGNKQCSDYAENSKILQMGTTSPVAEGSLSGPENPRDDVNDFPDSTGETASYSVGAGTVVGFQASTPIDFALLKSQRSIAVIVYPSGGVTSDSDMRLRVADLDLSITAISLCYGLGNVAPTPPSPPPPLTIKSCNVNNALLDDTGVTCPAGNERQLVCNFELDKPFYGLKDGTDSCCVCNALAPVPLVECNPELAAGDPADEGGRPPCPNPKSTEQPLPTEVTTHIELNNDPYYCQTVSGIRTCYKY